MYKCINNTIGNVYHLEQIVDNFFPYSQKKLGFDKDVTIIFQSDEENASKVLGKTAHYDPTNHEVMLYIDNRHPKDILRSLSHELVHHAQNCRGDFTGDSATYDGYAQKNPHLRKMEREAYTKGNLIFRDFEDLIKTGKINIEIDFSDSGEPEMSLKEWKNNEINKKLMKKWGLLKEERGPSSDQPGKSHRGESCAEAHPEETAEAGGDIAEGHRAWMDRGGNGEDELEESGLYRDDDEGAWGPTRRHDDPIPVVGDDDPDIGAWSREKDPAEDPEHLDPSGRMRLDYERDPVHFKGWGGASRGMKGPEVPGFDEPEPKTWDRRPDRAASEEEHGDWKERKRAAFAKQFKEGKISVKEVKEITRRIIERIKKEGK